MHHRMDLQYRSMRMEIIKPGEMTTEYIAHIRSSDRKIQTLEKHLCEVSEIASELAEKVGSREAGALLGLMHDFGKYSSEFQNYIKSAKGEINPDEDDYIDAKGMKGKVDHSSAGAQWIWHELKDERLGGASLCAQILALCVASHHSGLIDCLKPEGGNSFIARMNKDDEKTHLRECKAKAPTGILERAKLLTSETLLRDMCQHLQQFTSNNQHGQNISEKIKYFYIGLWARFLFSCLIDADRINSADFETPKNKQYRHNSNVNWQAAIHRTEIFLADLPVRNPIDIIRRDISEKCKKRAIEQQGLYTLTVPTGGGKTFTSLRFALHHAKKHQLDRIIYVIPYTSIIDQNATEIRRIIEREDDPRPWILEHHSNLEPEQQTWHSKLVAENWDAPIILTTMVQFLETLFGAGTRGVRRMHQLTNSIIIFDEIQTLPIKCTHLFCNALNYLTTYAKTTAVLCTATQPLLNKLKSPEKGELFLPKDAELIGDAASVESLFDELKRVTVCNRVRPGGWTENEVAELAVSEFQKAGSCLIIVNTKAWAHTLYGICSSTVDKDSLFHLSTNQCPTHRKTILKRVRYKLDNNEPVLCISTQLVEAGVDIDFGSVIRALAGLDSIAQAAGRCNRNGRKDRGIVHVVNPKKETIDLLKDIKEGRDKARRVLDEVDSDDILNPKTMNQYFNYYFFGRTDEMSYPVTEKYATRADTLLNLLSDNENNVTKHSNSLLRQSFMAAGKAFKAIEAPTETLIVPYGKGKETITNLCAAAKEFNPGWYYDLIKEAQQYSVNLFPNVRQKLADAGAIYEIQSEGIYYLDECFYSDEFGVSTEKVKQLAPLVC